MSAPPPCAERVFLLWYALIRTNDTHAADFDLSKVLGAYYSTEVETKQSHDLGDIFQLSMRLPKKTKPSSHTEIGSSESPSPKPSKLHRQPEMLNTSPIKISFRDSLLPSDPPTMIGSLNSTKPSVYERVNQKHLRLDNFAAFEDLRTISLSEYGMGLNAVEGSSARSGRGNR